MKMKLAFSTLACEDMTIEEIIKLAKDNCYNGIELRTINKHIDVSSNYEKRKEIKKKFKENSINICCLAGYTRFDTPQALDEQIVQLKKLIKLAADLEIPYIRTFGGKITLIQEAFNQVTKLLKKHNIKVLLETHDVLSLGSEVTKVFDKVDNNCFGVIWDVKHTICAGETLEETIKYLKNHICHIHIKDWIKLPRLNGMAEHLVLLGAGELQTEKLIELLDGIDYKGYLTLEWEKPWMPEIEDSNIAIYQYALKLKNILQ